MALSQFEKTMKRANTILSNADKMGLSNDAIESARHMLKIQYAKLEQSGDFKARNPNVFTKSKKLDWKQQRIFENIANNLIENPQANVKQIFSKKNQPRIEQIMNEQGLQTKQEVLDFFDIMNRTKSNKMIKNFLDSNQIKEMFDIAKKKDMTTDDLNKIINEEIKKEARKQIAESGFIEQTDDVAIAIRKRLRRRRNKKWLN